VDQTLPDLGFFEMGCLALIVLFCNLPGGSEWIFSLVGCGPSLAERFLYCFGTSVTTCDGCRKTSTCTLIRPYLWCDGNVAIFMVWWVSCGYSRDGYHVVIPEPECVHKDM